MTLINDVELYAVSLNINFISKLQDENSIESLLCYHFDLEGTTYEFNKTPIVDINNLPDNWNKEDHPFSCNYVSIIHDDKKTIEEVFNSDIKLYYIEVLIYFIILDDCGDNINSFINYYFDTCDKHVTYCVDTITHKDQLGEGWTEYDYPFITNAIDEETSLLTINWFLD